MIDALARAAGRPRPVLVAVLLLGVLTAALSSVPLAARALVPGRDFSDYRARARSWQALTGGFAVALVLGRGALLVTLGAFCLECARELSGLLDVRGRAARGLCYAAVVAQFAVIASTRSDLAMLAVPVIAVALAGPLALAAESPAGFGSRVSGALTTVMFAGVLLGFLGALAVLPDASNPAAGGLGWAFFLVFTAQGNDLLQYFAGRVAGRRPLSPKVSPKKTWEGFLGGAALTALGAAASAPLFTPVGRLEAALVGLLIAVAGLLGDLTLSAFKRDAGVKDTASFLPGIGGMFDRLDSLVYAAPLFYFYVRIRW